jgi:O-antigen ligase
MHLQRNKSSWKIVVAGGGGLATLLLGILFSQSRGVWLGVGLGLVINSLLLPKKLKYVGLVGLILFGSLLWFASPQIRTRAQSIFSMTSGSAADQQSSATRFSLWKAALQEIKQKPLFGNGLKEVELRVSTPPEAVGKTWSETHNSFLQVALDRGLVGLGLFLWILIVALGTILRTPKPWRTALLASFAAFMVAGLTESWIGDKEVAMIFWALLGAAEHLRRQGNRDEKIKN